MWLAVILLHAAMSIEADGEDDGMHRYVMTKSIAFSQQRTNSRIMVSKSRHVAQLDELCARMHNNTALEGVDPVDMLQANAAECQKNCVDMYPMCTAVVYYYMNEQDQHHSCYLFKYNSLYENTILVKQYPEHEKDLVRMLELVANCHRFDAAPPLDEDDVVSSTDKVDRKKRQNSNITSILGVGDWTDWSSCTKNGFESRSQVCEYGRKIQRRGCPARKPLQSFAVQSPPLGLRPNAPSQTAQLKQPYTRAEPSRHDQSPYDAHARRYLEQLSRQRVLQRHSAMQQPQPCPQGICRPPSPPTQHQYSALSQNQVQDTARSEPRPQVTRYRPAPPPPPICNGDGCSPQNTSYVGDFAMPAVFAYGRCLGVWYEWSDWSACSCTCDVGIKQRRRECMTDNCQGLHYETAPCDMGPCETWSEWCEWSPCSRSCGRGERTRTRFCNLGTQRCEGKDFEVEVCDAGPCPGWASWEEWSGCSSSCGTGVSQRQRTCLRGIQHHFCPDCYSYSSTFAQRCVMEQHKTLLSRPFRLDVSSWDICYAYPKMAAVLQGANREERSCEELPCSFWSSWQDWSSCSVSCGNGMKRRQRVCQYGTDCPGPVEEREPCYNLPCATWTQWQEWSTCSSKCGPGQRSRTRSCRTADGAESRECPGMLVETALCEEISCCRWSDWCAWSACDRECGIGHSIRTRACINGEGMIDTKCHCEGVGSEQKECNMQPCALQCAWTQWCAWSDCTTRSQCEIGMQSRSRQCVGEAGCHCIGIAEENQQCRGDTPCSTKAPC